MKRYNYQLSLIILLLVFKIASGKQQFISIKNTNLSSDTKIENLKNQSKEFYQAQIDSDTKKLYKFIYFPKAVKETAKKEKEYRERNSKALVQYNDLLKETGITIEIAKVNEPSQIIDEYKQLFSIVLIDTFWITPDGKCKITVCVLGISHDKGNTWEFFNGSCSDDTFPQRFGRYFPKVVNKMNFPKRNAPNCSPK